MIDAPQSSPPLGRLPASVRAPVRTPLLALCLILLGLLAVQPLVGQERRLTSETQLRKEPSGSVLGRLPLGSSVSVGRMNGPWVEATVDGWIYAASVGPSRQGDFDLVVTAKDGENLRAEPNGPIVGRLWNGALLEQRERRERWVRVRRSGWIPKSALEEARPARRDAPTETAIARRQPAAGQPATGQPATGAAADSAPMPSGAVEERVEAVRTAPLFVVPDSAAAGALEPGTSARVMARSGEWARVRIEAWMRESDLQPAGDSALVGVTAAEVRADPERYVGRVVVWRVQFIAVQTADALRPELTAGEPYLLTRGPLPEPGFVYVQVSDEQLARVQALPVLAELTIRATIRAPRSRFLATPVVQLVSVVSSSP